VPALRMRHAHWYHYNEMRARLGQNDGPLLTQRTWTGCQPAPAPQQTLLMCMLCFRKFSDMVI